MRAAFFSRLALALLAVLGFVAPVAERQVDEQVQTSRRVVGRKVAVVAPEVAPSLADDDVPAPRGALRADARAPRRTRYLEHRAWLI